VAFTKGKGHWRGEEWGFKKRPQGYCHDYFVLTHNSSIVFVVGTLQRVTYHQRYLDNLVHSAPTTV
jgi:hypothetical protein